MNTEKLSSSPVWRRPWVRRAEWLLGGILLVWLLAWLAVPGLLRTQLETRLGEQLGRRVTVGLIEFKPWSLELTVHDLAVAGVSGRAGSVASIEPQLSVKRLYIDAAVQSLWRLALVMEAVTVDSPQLRLAYLGDGHYDVDDVLVKLVGQPTTPAAPPFPFVLHNLTLTHGALMFEDGPHAQSHHLTEIQLGLPLLGSLTAMRDVVAQPKFAFELDGRHVAMTADSTPFAPTRKTDLRLNVKDLDLAPYLGYLPADLPLRLRAAVLDADLTLAFQQTAQMALTLRGEVSARSVRLAEPGVPKDGEDVLDFERLTVQLKAVQPLAKDVQLGRIDWLQPRVRVQRDRAGQLNWLTLFKPAADKRAVVASPSAPAQPWQLGVEQIAVQGGEVLWSDASTATPAHLKLDALDLQAQSLAWPMRQPMTFEGRARLDQAALAFQGSATDQTADVTAKLTGLPLSLAAPYLADRLTPTLNGLLSTDAAVHWHAASAADARDKSGQTLVQLPRLTLDQLVLTGARKNRLASVGQVQLSDVALDLDRKTLQLSRARVTQPSLRLTRAENGRWMFEDWLKSGSAMAGARAPARPASRGQPWSLAVNDFGLSGGSLGFQDRTQVKPVTFDLSAVALQLKNFAPLSRKPFGLTLSARMRHGYDDPGTLVWRGSASLSPLNVRGDLSAGRLPLHALEPYLSQFLNLELRRADTSFKGQIRFAQQKAGVALQVHGDTRLDDVQAYTLAQAQPPVPAQELLNLQTLSLRGVDLALAPGSAMRIDVQDTVLSDFYARLMLDEAGRFNLQDLIKPAPPVAAAPASAPTAAVPAAGPSRADDPLAPVIRFGPMSLQGGRVDFTDHFIRPNYATQLTELAGKLSAFASQNVTGELQLADLELRGRAEGSASLEIVGKINPLARPLALDLRGRVRDLELSPLSTYAARYAGYGIERGKLSVDVDYKVQPDGQLTANNNIILNQLKFGDAVPGATNSLPVKLAVALLADRNGVIDINLPVSGALNDPQFRLMPIVFKIIGNLIVKAVAAPFSLLAKAFGDGGEALSAVNFAPGSALLDAQAKAGLDKVAQALQDRPALKMTVIGSASLAQEREAFKRVQLQALMLAEQRRSAASDGRVPAGQAAAQVVSAQEYPVLLKAVYRRADFPKPRNLIGLAKDIPVPDMEALLLANLSATESDMQVLAVQRGVAVRDYLVSLKLPMDRLFLGAPKTPVPDDHWQPRAELNLAID